jgi:hexulose-6-phosphate isomerase
MHPVATTRPRLGFMQGRLSPQVDGKIQAFPAAHWRDEYPLAQQLGLSLMEWTLDQEGLADNPLMSRSGRAEIKDLGRRHGVAVETLTGDLFMQAPFWKHDGIERSKLLETFDAVLDASANAGIRIAVVPLVDNGRLDAAGEAVLEEALLSRVPRLRQQGLVITFESDLPPEDLARLIARFPSDVFGVNYDIGNSASLGFDCSAEIAAYGSRILNVHIKDRLRGGTTVPLGTGAADLPTALRLLRQSGYGGRYILQTARASDGDHLGALTRFRDMSLNWLTEPLA